MLDSPLSHLLVVLVPVIISFFKSFKFIQEGEQGIKLRFGKALKDRDGKPRIIDPGFVLLIPWVESLKRHHVRQQTIHFMDQVILTKDSLTFIVNAIVIFRVTDIYKALFEILDVNQSIEDVGMGILRDEISSREHDKLGDTEEISQQLLGKIKNLADQWGVEFVQFKLTDCAPTPETAPLVVAETGAMMRATALQKAAESLGTSIEKLPSELAAVLVGIPLVSAIGSRPSNNGHRQPTHVNSDEEEKPSLVERLLTN